MKTVKTKTCKSLSRRRILEVLESHRDSIRKFAVNRIGLFGSCLAGRAKPSSDIDILVEFDKTTFDNYMDLKFYLEDLFGRKVDLVVRGAIKPRLRKPILNEVVYAQGF